MIAAAAARDARRSGPGTISPRCSPRPPRGCGDGGLRAGDVLAIAHKAVAKAEGRVVRLADVEPGARARELAAEHGKDPRLVELILGESVELVRADAGRLIARTRHGFVCANAGVDQSNAGGEEQAVLLPARSRRRPRARCARGSAARS